MKKLLIGCVLLVSVVFEASAQIPKSIVPEQCMKPFYHGVASGDALHDRVIIWTRVTPSAQNQQPAAVSWKIATDTGMTQLVQSGSVLTTIERDYTVKIDVQNLQADTRYYYEFYSEGKRSIQGRTHTAPHPTALKDSLRFAVVSCANLEAGYFNVYGSLVQRQDFDAVICLGDYYYEYESGGYSPNPQTQRFFEPTNEIISVEDYRMRHSIYRLDPDLRRLHQSFPWYFVWDDHEFANDAWTGGAENHSTNEGNWSNRKSASKQAYFEWIPIRDNNTQGLYEIYRNISYGQLVDLIFLDTRIKGRNQQVSAGSSQANAANRTLLGAEQFAWLLQELTSSQATYKVIAQQVMMGPLEVFGVAVNMDQWDGYPAERAQILNHIVAENVDNVVVLTGDIHTSWAMNLPTPNGNAGVEFVTPSVTSPALEAIAAVSYVGEAAIEAANPHIKWVDLTQHGYLIVDYNQSRVQSDWYFVNTIDEADNTAFSWGKSYYASVGTNTLYETSTVASVRDGIFAMLPQLCPRPIQPIDEEENNLGLEASENVIVFGLYPNPAKHHLVVHFASLLSDQFTWEIVNASGQVVLRGQFDCQMGSWNYPIETSNLSAGFYTLHLQNATQHVVKSFVKE